MDFGKAFTYMFQDPQWLGKLGIGTLLMLIGIIFSPVLVGLIPIIIVTARAQAIDRVLGLHIAKVDDYICKPFRPQELIESVEHVLGIVPPATKSQYPLN